MRIAIHQPHYFPWLGYFDKIAKVDKFVLLDKVQFEKGSQMIRNKVLSDIGEIKYITISADTKNFLEREYRDILIKNPEEWKDKQRNALKNYYRKSEYFGETYEMFDSFLKNEYQSLCEWTCESIKLICRILDINTSLIYQSDIDYIENGKKSDLVLEINKALHSQCYFSGRGGSVDYLDRKKFEENDVDIEFQDFMHPVYKQCGTNEFVSGLSILDMMMNCGVDETKLIFWNNCKNSENMAKRR